jgi:TRAP-type C4-dicarboxylate transport system substrate-binding protein
MTFSRTWSFVIALAAALIFGGTAHAQVINWQDHKINPAGFWLTANEANWAKGVDEATKGRLKIRVFPAGSSGFKGGEALDAASENLLQIAEVWGGHVAGQEQILEMLDLPEFVPADFNFRVKLWQALIPLYAELFDKKYGLYLFDFMQLNPRRLFTKKEVKSLEDVKGQKIRAIGPADAAFVRAIGAVPTTTEWTELYTALQQGVVDGLMAADGPALAMKFYEVTGNTFNTANAGPTFFILVNKKALASLPEDVRKTFLGMRDKLRELNYTSYQVMDQKAREGLIKNGMKVHEVSAADRAFMRKVAQPIVMEWASRLKPDSRKIFDLANSMIEKFEAGK